MNNFFVKDIFYPVEIDRNFLIDIIYPLSANPTKGSNTLKQLLECVDHFVGVALKRLINSVIWLAIVRLDKFNGLIRRLKAFG